MPIALIQYGRTRDLNLNKAKTNWCPDCQEYTNQNHDCPKASSTRSSGIQKITGDSGERRSVDVPPAGVPGATSPSIGDNMPAKKAVVKKSNGHRNGVLYKALAKLATAKLRENSQAAIVAKALVAFTTPKDLDTLTAKAKDFGLKTKTPLADSVHFHLRRFVADGLVTEGKAEPVETTTTA